ncbi:hypothetical protein GC169_05240 [bacterium]|nr:hypothetical protein [bacterium]
MGRGPGTSEEVDAYVARAPEPARVILSRVRDLARLVAPDAEEVISYQMPALKGAGMLVYFGAFKRHIGMFPPIEGDPALEAELSPFRGPKGNLEFPYSQAFPYDLVKRIIALRVAQDAVKARMKAR